MKEHDCAFSFSFPLHYTAMKENKAQSNQTKHTTAQPNLQTINRKYQTTKHWPLGLPAQQLASYKSLAVVPRQSLTVEGGQIYKSQDTNYKAVVLCCFCRSSQTPESPKHQT